MKKNKRKKRHVVGLLTVMMAALAIVLTQCKKPILQSLNAGGTVSITLSVDGNSKLTVTPGSSIATVEFTTGDAIYVASDGKYVGTLYHDGTNFKGDITDATTGVPLYFYFLGNKDAKNPSGNPLITTISTSLMVNISDQSGSLPVISYAASNENYTGSRRYTAELKNQCGLVKFTVSGYSGSGDVIVTGMNNKVEITNLSAPTFTYGKMTTRGDVKLYRKTNEEYWAILLPQDAVNTVCDGEVFTSEGHYTGTHTDIPAIEANGYITGDDAVTITLSDYVDLGLSNGLKWAKCNVGAETTWEYGGYFAWGETTPYNQVPSAYPSGWTGGTNSNYYYLVTKHGAKTEYDWTQYKWGTSDSDMLKYTGSDSYGTTLESSDDAAYANWGGSWRMPTTAECKELSDNTTREWITQNGVYGLKFTSNVSGYTDRSIFLPAAGYRSGSSRYSAGSHCRYWSSSLCLSYLYCAYDMDFYSSQVHPSISDRRGLGFTVRPVQ